MISAEELKGRLPTCDAVAHDLYGIEFLRNVARCTFPTNHNNGDRDPSLQYDPKKNRIFCASQQCFGENGVDAFGLVQRMEPCDFPTALSILQGRYGPFNGTGTHHSGRTLTKPPRRTLAETVRESRAREGFQVADEFYYFTELRKVRFEHKTKTQPGKGRPEKTFRWESFSDGQWWSGDGGKEKRLFVNQVFRQRDQLGTVLGVEGEVKAILAGKLGLPAFSFREEVSPKQAANLVDCDVILWADNDSAGTKLALARAEVLAQHSQARSISIIEPPGELPVSGDIVDAIHSLGWDRQRIENLLCGARPYSAESTSSAPTDLTAEPAGTQPCPFEFQVERFPVEVLPEPLARFVSEASQALPCPPDFVAVPMLALLGSAIGTSTVIEIKPGWHEGSRLYTAVRPWLPTPAPRNRRL